MIELKRSCKITWKDYSKYVYALGPSQTLFTDII